MGDVLATDRKRQLLTLGACCFGLFMVMLDNTVVNVALPSIQRELEATLWWPWSWTPTSWCSPACC